MTSEITVSELQAKGPDIELIDVRTPAEYAAIRVPFAKNYPLDQLAAPGLVARQATSEVPLFVICKMGGRSAKACQQLEAAGLTNVVNVIGGTDAWAAAGYEVEKSGRKTIALDRQVRITAGTVVVTGVVLSAVVEPAWMGLALAGFIGVGLMFSGITDTCGMGVVLSKMPWNR
ncbi:MAG: rhodanese-like domain-containing protein [Pirellulaceae bacterium]|nr:rhodanese-like domain-containing protein [Pirellulaceae bacterium]